MINNEFDKNKNKNSGIIFLNKLKILSKSRNIKAVERPKFLTSKLEKFLIF